MEDEYITTKEISKVTVKHFVYGIKKVKYLLS